jgi:hypothetical protein
MKKITIEFPSGFEDTLNTPAFILLGRLHVGDSVCRMVLGEDGKTRLFCNHETQPFIEFIPKLKDLLI